MIRFTLLMLYDARPVVHLTPPVGWLNDPNGLISVDGRHHAFYQHNPDDTAWGSMHWGHAVSDDFLAWRHLPIVLSPDEHGTIYSGSAVVDVDDTAGFGAGALVAVFTYHTTELETQALAWSTDGGRTFATYDGNPVLTSPPERPLCRDPKVLWHAATGQWIMVLAAGPEVWTYTSPDLHRWIHTDTVTGCTPVAEPIETPDLFPLVDDGGVTRWVLTTGVVTGAPAGGSGTAAVVGDFDGSRFAPSGEPHWVDHGRHFYAAQTWGGLDDRRVWTAWMGNWADGPQEHGGTWRGQLAVPRQLSLRGDRLVQTPVDELDRLHAPGNTGVALDVRATAKAPLTIACRRVGVDVIVRVGPTDLVTERRGTPARRASHGHGVRDVRIVLDVGSIEAFCGTAAISELLDLDATDWEVDVRGGGDAELTIRRLRRPSANMGDDDQAP